MGRFYDHAAFVQNFTESVNTLRGRGDAPLIFRPQIFNRINRRSVASGLLRITPAKFAGIRGHLSRLTYRPSYNFNDDDYEPRDDFIRKIVGPRPQYDTRISKFLDHAISPRVRYNTNITKRLDRQINPISRYSTNFGCYPLPEPAAEPTASIRHADHANARRAKSAPISNTTPRSPNS